MICARRANTNTHARNNREKQKKRNLPLGKSNAKSATCVFALVSLSFAIKMRPITQFENRTSTFGPISGHFFAPYFSHSLVVWSTCKMFFASSLTAINVAYGSGVCSSSSSVIFLSSSSLRVLFPRKTRVNERSFFFLFRSRSRKKIYLGFRFSSKERAGKTHTSLYGNHHTRHLHTSTRKKRERQTTGRDCAPAAGETFCFDSLFLYHYRLRA